MNRTNYLGEIGNENIGQKVKVYGWIKKHRDLGELIFIDLQDFTGYSQIVVTSECKEFSLSHGFRMDYVVAIEGVVRKREEVNCKIPTGNIEILATSIQVINKSEPVPLINEDETDASEETRLAYRYLDLRRKPMQDNLKLRHKTAKTIRNFLDGEHFLEVETPMLTKSTPEGARDYLVPSRVNKGKYYALPQSPQIYKNLLMIAGVDRYYQIVKCFRDEDLRSDRQPEFTQVDIEMSFMSEEQIRDITEIMLKEVMLEVKGLDIKEKFPIMTYSYAMDKYGVDKPDTRFNMMINDVTSLFSDSEFTVFKNAELVRNIVVKDAASDYSRKDITKLEDVCKKHHAKGMAWLKLVDGEFTGSIAKVISDSEKMNLISDLNLENNDLILFIADKFEIVCSALGNLRNFIATQRNMYSKDDFNFVWIIDWPMFEYDEKLERYFAMHHPFTMPKNGEFSKSNLEQMAQSYDIVLNGYEVGGGSIRINTPELQMEMFEKLGFEKEDAIKEFGFMMDAYKYGGPHHGGIALGLDRLVMILAGTDSIKDVIAFPKNNKAIETMIDSPSNVSELQLGELNIIEKNGTSNE